MRLKFVYSFKRRFQRLFDISRTDYGKFVKAIVIEFEENRIITAISQDRVLKEGMFMTTMLCPNRGREVFYYDKQRIPLSKQATYRYNALVSEKEVNHHTPRYNAQMLRTMCVAYQAGFESTGVTYGTKRPARTSLAAADGLVKNGRTRSRRRSEED